MAARSRPVGLSDDDARTVREAVAAGRRPRVLFTPAAGQIAGQLGQVVAVRDPADGPDWLVVRFGRDELPFSPGELCVAPKGAGRRAARPPAAAPEAGPVVAAGPAFVLDGPAGAARSSPARSSPARSSPAGSAAGGSAAGGSAAGGSAAGGSAAGGSAVAAHPATTTTPAARSAAAAKPAHAKPAAAKPAAAAGAAGPAAVPARRRAARSREPELAVTVAYADGGWSVQLRRGAAAAGPARPVAAAVALRMLAPVPDPAVRAAVDGVVAAQRAEAQDRAQRLRAELAEVEQRLAELHDAG